MIKKNTYSKRQVKELNYKNIKLNNLNPIIKVIEIGVSNFNGEAKISNEGGGSTIQDGTGESLIQITTLDQIFKDYDITNVNVLKVDVEGSEPDIILAASKDTLSACKYIAIEFDVRTGSKLGEMVMKLSETHHVRTMGSWERGGMIFANRY
jgi:FkbM family methyltransferase